MNTQPHHSKAERFGQWLGSVWRGYRRRERQVARWLIGHGLPSNFAMGGLWLVRLLVLGVMLYFSFWLVLLVVIAMVARAAAQKPTDSLTDDEKDEWRMGWSGYGLYRDDTRIDPGSDDEY